MPRARPHRAWHFQLLWGEIGAEMKFFRVVPPTHVGGSLDDEVTQEGSNAECVPGAIPSFEFRWETASFTS